MRSWPSAGVPTLPAAVSPTVLRVFDTAAAGLVALAPTGGIARLYVCGITPYDATHLGHAATYLAFDTLVRVWRDQGLEVRYVQNVTSSTTRCWSGRPGTAWSGPLSPSATSSCSATT